jgi:hypothetical protein
VRDVIGREVMLEKQWMGQQVDRSICSWFWKQLHSGVRKKELLLLCFSLSLSQYLWEDSSKGFRVDQCIPSSCSMFICFSSITEGPQMGAGLTRVSSFYSGTHHPLCDLDHGLLPVIASSLLLKCRLGLSG